MTLLPLEQFATDTLGLIATNHTVHLTLPQDVAWLLTVLLLAGLWVVVHTVVMAVQSVLHKTKARMW